MTTIPIDHGRITTRVSLQMRETLALAAEMTGTTINQFIIQTAMREAERVIEQERVIRLSARDTASFLDMEAGIADHVWSLEEIAALA